MGEVYKSRAMKGATLTNDEADVIVGNPTFTQSAHGFVVGDVVRRSTATDHAKAQADSDVNVGVGLALVIDVPDVDTFSILRTNSNHTVNLPSHGLGSFGDKLYLSTTVAGAITATEVIGSRIYLGYVIDDDHIHWEPGWVKY